MNERKGVFTALSTHFRRTIYTCSPFRHTLTLASGLVSFRGQQL